MDSSANALIGFSPTYNADKLRDVLEIAKRYPRLEPMLQRLWANGSGPDAMDVFADLFRTKTLRALQDGLRSIAEYHQSHPQDEASIETTLPTALSGNQALMRCFRISRKLIRLRAQNILGRIESLYEQTSFIDAFQTLDAELSDRSSATS